MAVYVTKKCPHCGHAYQYRQNGEQRKYGCPYKICMICGESFWDTDIKEPALHGFENAYETGQSIKRVFTLILYSPMLLISIYGAKLLLSEGDVLIGIVSLLMGAGLLWAYIAFIKEAIDNKRNHAEIIANQQQRYDESVERLKNTTYLTALSKHDDRAYKLLQERMNGEVEHYAKRP